MKFSIIIPAYNMELYIAECVGSLVNQDFPKEEYEIIVVDDCSTDKTLEKLTSTPPISHNLTVVKLPENRRQGGARNAGIEIAKGDWVLFLDADDYWFDSSALSRLSEVVDAMPGDVDVVRTVGYEYVGKDGNDTDGMPPVYIETMTGDSLLGSERYDHNMYVVWTSAYRRAFLKDNGLKFAEHMLYEDSDWTVRCLHAARKVAIYAYGFVFHRIREDSSASAPKVRNFLDNIKAVTMVDAQIEALGLTGQAERICRRRNKRAVLSYVKKTRNYTVSQSRECISALRRTSLLDTSKYELSRGERVLFGMLRHTPTALIVGVKGITLAKRFILNTILRRNRG